MVQKNIRVRIRRKFFKISRKGKRSLSKLILFISRNKYHFIYGSIICFMFGENERLKSEILKLVTSKADQPLITVRDIFVFIYNYTGFVVLLSRIG